MVKVNLEETGRNIMDRCKASGMTMTALTESLGLERTVPYMWRLGRCAPRLTTLVNVAHLLGCSVDELIVVEELDDNAEIPNED